MTLRRATSPCRTTWWSSTTRVLIRSVMPSFPSILQRYAQRDRSAALGRAFHLQRSANLISPFAHSLKSEVSLCSQICITCLEPFAIVRNRQLKLVWMIAQIKRGMGRSGVTDDVGKRLLRNPEYFVLERSSEGAIDAPDGYIGFE